MLLEAAILATNGKDNPADHLTGVYTDIQRDDINKCAWIVYSEYHEEKELERSRNKLGMKWIGGKGKSKVKVGK